MSAPPAGGEDFEDLYGDLYGDVDPPAAPEPTPAPAPAAAAAAVAPASSSDPRTRAALPTPPPAPATAPIPSFTAPMPGLNGLPPTPQPAAYGMPPQHAPPIHYEPGYSSHSRPNVRPSDMPDEGKMFVGGLNWDTTDDALKAYFEQFGKISHCTIMRDSETQRSRGFAFLTFEDPASVNAVMSRDHYLDGKTIDPKRAIPRAEGQKTDKLFVRSIPNSCTQESFRAFWRNFGSITDATLMMDKESGRHRGFGFVNYEHLESVEKVLSTGPHMMDGQALEVKRAQAKGDNQRQNNFGGGGGGGNQQYGGGGGQHHNQQYQPAPMAPVPSNPMAAMQNGGGGPGGFDAQAMAKFFQQMGWGAWNPLMMMQPGGMGGMGMPGMPGMPQGMPGMGMPGMGGFGGGFGGMPGMMGMDPSMGMYGAMGPGASASPSGAGQEFDGGQSPDANNGGGGGGHNNNAGAGHSPWTAPMAQQSMRGGRGGGRGGRGGRDFNPPTGPAAMRGSGETTPDAGGTGPSRNRGGGAGYHPYSR